MADLLTRNRSAILFFPEAINARHTLHLPRYAKCHASN